MKRTVLCLLFVSLVSGLCARTLDEQRAGSRAWMFGAGSIRQQDTYLSPLVYRGAGVSLLTESLRKTRYAEGRVSFQSIFQANASFSQNEPRTSRYWGGRLAYDAGWHYHWTPTPSLRLMLGGQIGVDAGFLYRPAGGNNPAQGRLSVDFAVSAAAIYGFNVGRQPFKARLQADLPLAGCMFTPQYGQSYFELSQGNRDHNVVFAYPGNAMNVRTLFTLDVPFQRCTLRVGWMCDVRQSRIHHLHMADVGNSALIGVVRHFSLLRRKHKEMKNFIL